MGGRYGGDIRRDNRRGWRPSPTLIASLEALGREVRPKPSPTKPPQTQRRPTSA